MLWADCALTAAGSTIYELAYFGVPMLLVVLAENQAPGALRMAELSAARNLGPASRLTPAAIASELRTFLAESEARSAQSDVSRGLIDGRGAERTVTAMQQQFLRLRTATQEDDRFLYELANDLQVRAASFSSEPIPWDDHERWLRHKLADPNAAIFIAEEVGSTRAGAVRFDVADGTAVISVALTGAFRGRGHSRSLIDFAVRRILARPDVSAIRAFVKSQNQASARAFLSAGFTEDVEAGGRAARSFTLFRS
jgi:RimJ/RimL family protein N-acetyltransferase